MIGKKLVLFDIDHTLMDVGDCHKRAFSKAFKEILGIEIGYDNWTYHGYTDLQIIHEILKRNRLERKPEEIEKIIEAMIKSFKGENLSQCKLLKGAPEIIERLSKDKNIILGLVTGNVEEIAYTKLRHFKMKEFFLLGGFGNISDIRADLVEFAVKQAQSFSPEIEKSKVFIIGDTIYDIRAAREAKVKSIAVATGTYPYKRLEQESPDYIFPDLTNADRIIEVIKNG